MSEFTAMEGRSEAAYDSLTPEQMETICDMAHAWTVETCKDSGIKVWTKDGKDERYTDEAQQVFNLHHDEAETQFVEGIAI